MVDRAVPKIAPVRYHDATCTDRFVLEEKRRGEQQQRNEGLRVTCVDEWH
jgi:hypothetical protein